MDFSLSDEQKLLRENIVRFAREVLSPGAAERDREQAFSRELWRKCGEIGIQGLPVPEQYGGSGVDPLTCAIALEGLGYGCRDGGLVFSLCAHLLSCVVPLWQHGNEAQKRRYLPGLCDGTLIGVHAMTEPNSGSDAFALRTKAEPDGAGFRINGTKTFISNGPVADVVIVFAMTDPKKGYHGGVTAFLVERGMAGFAAGTKFDKLGLRTSPIFTCRPRRCSAASVRDRRSSRRPWTGSGSACSRATSEPWSGWSRPRSRTPARARSSARQSESSRLSVIASPT
jgi:alkylation response protein AidB-like acyl-CoA dehydrogenase